MFFKKSNIFTFSHSKNLMNANYAEICRVGSLGADFQQVLLVQFSEIFTILLWNINNSNSVKKSKKYFLRQKFKNKIINK